MMAASFWRIFLFLLLDCAGCVVLAKECSSLFDCPDFCCSGVCCTFEESRQQSMTIFFSISGTVAAVFISCCCALFCCNFCCNTCNAHVLRRDEQQRQRQFWQQQQQGEQRIHVSVNVPPQQQQQPHPPSPPKGPSAPPEDPPPSYQSIIENEEKPLQGQTQPASNPHY